jgi:DNA-binding NarL/FixJ family response regulator
MRHVARQECVVLVIDHQPLFLEALANAVATIPQVRVVKHLLRGNLEEIGDIAADVVIVDPYEGPEFRSEHVQTAKRLWPLCRLMVVTNCNQTDAVISALAYGAHSFILKMEPIDTIRAAVELVCRGAAAFSLPLAAAIAGKVAPSLTVPSLPAPTARGLSPREVEVMQMVARGYTNSEMAKMLGISPRTVERHITNILNKLGCRNRSQAVAQVIGAAAPLARKGRT